MTHHPIDTRTLTEHFVATREAAMKLAGKPQFDGSDCLLITPVEHQGMTYTRRCISGMKTIYHAPIPSKPHPATPSMPPSNHPSIP